jgi:hypothetical protein
VEKEMILDFGFWILDSRPPGIQDPNPKSKIQNPESK